MGEPLPGGPGSDRMDITLMKTPTLIAFIIAVALPASLLATPETDRRIEEAARSSYNYKTVLEDGVKVKADNGVVTLTGTVNDSSHRSLAADTVENIPGVTRVNNEIEVKETASEPSDTWIALKIRGVLLTRANVSAMDTQVQVNEGVVTLTGKARNQAQKELTGLYAAEIQHVKSVNNELTIVADPDDDHAAGTRTTDRKVGDRTTGDRTTDRKAGDRTDRDRTTDDRTLSDSMDDASITAQVKFALLGHRSTSALKTGVTTKDGVVVITGEAANDAEKALVGKLTERIRGVKSVDNKMTVKN